MTSGEISAGLGDLNTFRAQMLALIPRIEIVDGQMASYPLASLHVDMPSDPTVALVDAFAAVADVLSFYQDRILNEGYLPTALDPASLALLGQGLGVAAQPCVGATTNIALFAQAGSIISVPAGSIVPGPPPKSSSASTGTGSGGASGSGSKTGSSSSSTSTPSPVFATASTVQADPALNQLTLVQTRPPLVDPAANALLLAGTGLNLASGDFLLLVRRDADGDQWVRLTVHSATENSTLMTTTVNVGDSLGTQWTLGGATAPFPETPALGLEIYALDLACRLFGYNAPNWSQQTLSTQLAAMPPGEVPSAYSEWPDFAIDLSDLDLQAVYSKVLPGSAFLLETPESRLLGTISAVSRDNVSAYGMSGQATRVTLAADPSTLPSGLALIPARFGHSATLLDNGQVLIVGGINGDTVLTSVELYDPTTGLVSALAPLPAARGLHSASLINGVVYLAGGVTDRWDWATTLMALDPATMSFSVVPNLTLALPRLDHAATVLPDGTLMLSGGMTGTIDVTATGFARLAALTATTSVVVYVPNGGWAWATEQSLQRARAGHSAVACPITPDGGGATLGTVIVFVGGQDKVTAPTYWNDAEITDPVTWMPATGLFPLTNGVTTASARAYHAATPLPSNAGMLISGGKNVDGAVADNWLIAVTAPSPPAGQPPAPVPFFAATPGFSVARSNHAAALLGDGSVVAAGGEALGQALSSVEIFTIASGVQIAVDSNAVVTAQRTGMPLPAVQTRAGAAALQSGNLLLTGGLIGLPETVTDAVVAYDPAVATMGLVAGPILDPWTIAPTGSIALRDGTILLTGASQPTAFPYSPATMTGYGWTFDPATGLSSATGAPVTPRLGATLTMLANGTVLIAGGLGLQGTSPPLLQALDSCELYDPRTRSFRAIGSKMSIARFGHTATALSDGSVLIVGGFALPPVAYDPAGLDGVWAPGLDSAELYSSTGQGFTTISTPLPQGIGLHAATLLTDGSVLITGGVGEFWAFPDFSSTTFTPTAQAVVYDAVAQAFALVRSMATARAMHSANVLTNGKVLIAGGGTGASLTASAATETFDPTRNVFAAGTPLAVPRIGHATAPTPQGLIVIGGGATPTYEMIGTDGSSGGALPMPVALPSPPLPALATMTEQAVAVAIADYGVYSFGGAIAADGTSTCSGVLFVEPGAPPGAEARRQAMVYTQSRALTLANPINTLPQHGTVFYLAGLVSGLRVGQQLLFTGNPPLALTVGTVMAGEEPLESGTAVMPLTPAQRSSDSVTWQGELADGSLVTLTAEAQPDAPAGLTYLSGNGSTIGNIPSATLALFDRPALGESLSVSAIKQLPDHNCTRITLAAPLQYLYDRTTVVVYGNVVGVAEGAPVDGEVLGSGDGKQPFQTFLLKQAPLDWLEASDGALVPQLSVKVGGVTWQRVVTLSACDAEARAYQLVQDAAGRALIQFGNGVHGQRLPTGTNNVTADYRVGTGSAGNVAAGSLTRAPTGVGGIKSVLNPLPASGGIDPAPSRGLRAAIPAAVQDLGRIVTRGDMLSFVNNRPEVGAAVLRSVPNDPSETEGAPPGPQAAHQTLCTLITLAGPDKAVPDLSSQAYKALAAAFDSALAWPLSHRLLAYWPEPFKLRATFTVTNGSDPQKVQQSMIATIRTLYATPRRHFEEPVWQNVLERQLAKVPGVNSVNVTALWIPALKSQTLEPVLKTTPATLHPTPQGASILVLSPDDDAVDIVLPEGTTDDPAGDGTAAA